MNTSKNNKPDIGYSIKFFEGLTRSSVSSKLVFQVIANSSDPGRRAGRNLTSEHFDEFLFRSFVSVLSSSYNSVSHSAYSLPRWYHHYIVYILQFPCAGKEYNQGFLLKVQNELMDSLILSPSCVTTGRLFLVTLVTMILPLSICSFSMLRLASWVRSIFWMPFGKYLVIYAFFYQ